MKKMKKSEDSRRTPFSYTIVRRNGLALADYAENHHTTASRIVDGLVADFLKDKGINAEIVIEKLAEKEHRESVKSVAIEEHPMVVEYVEAHKDEPEYEQYAADLKLSRENPEEWAKVVKRRTLLSQIHEMEARGAGQEQIEAAREELYEI